MSNGARTKVAKLGTLTGVIVLAAGVAHAPAASAAPTDMELQDFAGSVETIGEEQFPDTFAGASVTSDGAVVVYATDPSNSALQTAITTLNTSGATVSYSAATYSFNQLDSMNSALVTAEPQLEAAGVKLASSAPDPQTGTVQVSVLQPTSADLAEMNANGVVPGELGTITAANYTAGASATVAALAGTQYAVDPILQQPAFDDAATGDNASDDVVQPDSGRMKGEAPFAGGDYIKPATVVLVTSCTGGFSVVGESGIPYMLSAGHCGRATWYTGAQKMGQTSSLYYKNPAHDDFQTIRVGSAVGRVNGNTTQYTVTGSIVPAVGSKMTIDGSKTYEQNNLRVVSNNRTVYNIKAPDGTKYTATHLVEVTGGVCTGGDSGGPMFVRKSTTAVKAVGTLVAYWGKASGGVECVGERIGYELSHSNTSLIVNGNVVKS